jgi:hypothetical protein
VDLSQRFGRFPLTRLGQRHETLDLVAIVDLSFF